MGNTQASTQCITWQNANERQKLKIQLAVWLCVRVCSEMTVNWELIRNTELSERKHIRLNREETLLKNEKREQRK